MKAILVVDDEPVIRTLVQLSLSAPDRAITVAQDAFEALAEIARSTPDLILLDLGLPGISGHELARRLRSGEGTAHIPIVYLTGANPESLEHASDLLQKPFTPDRLQAVAAAWL